MFFDEIDALAVQRGGSGSEGGSQVADRVLSQILHELDGIHPLKKVIIVAATNRPDLIDNALMRPGRIDRILYVGPPSKEARTDILNIHTRKMPLDKDVNINQLSEETDRYSGAELAALCREAALCAIEESRNATLVALRHFQQAKLLVKPQIDDAMLQFFENYEKKVKYNR